MKQIFSSIDLKSYFTIILNRTRMKYSGALLLLMLAFVGASKIKKDSKSEKGNNMQYHTM